MLVGAVWARSHNGVIGVGNKLPWHLPEDLKRFSQLTKGHTVVMGRNTWLSLPDTARPLPGRDNLIISRSGFTADRATTCTSVVDALEHAKRLHSDQVWFIGGEEIYASALPYVSVVEQTIVDVSLDGDAYAPQVGSEFYVSYREPFQLSPASGLKYRFETLQRQEWGWEAMQYGYSF